MAWPSVRQKPSEVSNAGTFPRGNLARNSGDLLVTPKTKLGSVASSRPLMAATVCAWACQCGWGKVNLGGEHTRATRKLLG